MEAQKVHAPARRSAHGHLWLVGLVGLAAGLALLVYVPSLKVVSASVLLFAGFHLVGLAVIGASTYLTWRSSPAAASRTARASGLAWLNGPLVAGLTVIAAAVAMQAAWPRAWPLALGLIAQGVLFLVGARLLREQADPDRAILPLVNLNLWRGAVVLDVGAGSGRSAFALAQAFPGEVTALEAFDGEADPWLVALRARLAAAGLEGRVRIASGPLGSMPWPAETFDAAACVHALEAPGAARAAVLAETARVLKPRGRLLLMVRTPSWRTFAILNVLVLLLAPPRRWKGLVEAAGFRVLRTGRFEGSWFVLAERP